MVQESILSSTYAMLAELTQDVQTRDVTIYKITAFQDIHRGDDDRTFRKVECHLIKYSFETAITGVMWGNKRRQMMTIKP